MNGEKVSLGPAVVITGASSPIGKAFSRLAAREGHFVVLVGRNEGVLDTQIQSTMGMTVCVDLSDGDAAEAIEKSLREKNRWCRILINAAGAACWGPAHHTTADQLRVVDINVRALTTLSLHFLQEMVGRKDGGIVNVSSIAAYAPGPYMSTYYASKAYLRSFSLALRQEVAPLGVSVCCLTMGPTSRALFERQDGWVSTLLRTDVDAAAAAGWLGLHTGRSEVVRGYWSWWLCAAATIVPAKIKAQLLERLQRKRE